MQKDFTSLLLQWNQSGNTRVMPWKGETNPYRIWLSEIILQQTRVDQGLAYYQRFIERFPGIRDLAMAKDEDVFKLWEGLGYYSRCRNLLATARYIAFEKEGIFPADYEEILKLKGVGPYTAAAIASFAYGQPFAVLDGNVFRVLARYFGVSTPIDSPDGKKLFSLLANALLDFKSPGIYNQAIMDFGAVVCKPQLPLCSSCVLNCDCDAYLNGFVQDVPVKSKSIRKRHRYFYYFILSFQDKYYIRQRTGSDIWQHLHEWVLLENDSPLDSDTAGFMKVLRQTIKAVRGRIRSISDARTQQLSHQTISGKFIRVDLKSTLPADEGYKLVTRAELNNYAFPRFITNYLEENPL
jgi:A/G-specific adenine glycosylase